MPTRPTRRSKLDEATARDSLAIITDRLKLLATRQSDLWWDNGRLLDEVAVRNLAGDLGYADYATYAHRVAGIAPAQARRLRRVAHHFSRETSMRLGIDRLDLLIQLLDASPEMLCSLDPMRVEVLSHRSEKSSARIPFAEATIEDLQRTVRLARRQHATADSSIPAEIAKRCQALQQDLDRCMGKGAPRVKVIRNTSADPETSLALLHVDPARLLELAKAIAQSASKADGSRRSVRPSKSERTRRVSKPRSPTAASRRRKT